MLSILLGFVHLPLWKWIVIGILRWLCYDSLITIHIALCTQVISSDANAKNLRGTLCRSPVFFLHSSLLSATPYGGLSTAVVSPDSASFWSLTSGSVLDSASVLSSWAKTWKVFQTVSWGNPRAHLIYTRSVKDPWSRPPASLVLKSSCFIYTAFCCCCCRSSRGGGVATPFHSILAKNESLQREFLSSSLYTIKFTHFKYMIQWFLINSQK